MASNEPDSEPPPDVSDADEADAAADAEASTKRPRLDAAGLERPGFLLDFPEDPELERLIAAFEAGNYAFVREHAPRLAEQSERPEVSRAARELARRIEPDPLIKYLLITAFALFFAVVSLVYYFHH